MVKWGSFLDQYIHPMQVTASLDKQNIQMYALSDNISKNLFLVTTHHMGTFRQHFHNFMA